MLNGIVGVAAKVVTKDAAVAAMRGAAVLGKRIVVGAVVIVGSEMVADGVKKTIRNIKEEKKNEEMIVDCE